MGCLCGGSDPKYKNARYGDPNYEGPPTDPKLRQGPISDRSCTDIICCIVFIAYLVVFAYIGYMATMGPTEAGAYGLRKGTPELYIGVYDGSGHMCGHKYNDTSDYSDYGYLYFWFPMTGYLNKTTCVKTCPPATVGSDFIKYYQMPGSTAIPEKVLDCKPNKLVPQCFGTTGISMGMDISSLGSTSFDNIYLVYPTVPKFYRFCIPTQLNDTLDAYYSKVKVYIESMDYASNAIADLTLTAPLIIGSCFIALLMGFLWMMVMKACAGPITWTFILLTQLLLAGIAYAVYDYATVTYQGELDKQRANGEAPGRNYYLYVAYFCIGIAVGFFIAICCLYTKIRIAIRIMETAADFVTEVCMVVLVPPVITVAIIIWILVFLSTFAYVWCMGDFKQAEGGQIYGEVTWNENTRYIVAYYLFGGLWVAAFINALNQFIIASAACIWYFSPRDMENENDKIVDAAVSRSVYRAFRYHLGSIAFGSFLVAVVQMCRLVLEYIHQQVKKSGADKKSKWIEYAFKAMAACLACFERCIKFINKNAYIQIAITSNCFCVACKDAFFLILRNTFLFAIVAGIGEVFVWAGRMFIAIVTVVICYFVIQNYDDYSGNLNYFYVPLFVIAMIAGVIAMMFMSVWAMAADSILMCFCVDKELNGGSTEANKYSPKQLLEFVQDDYNKLLAQEAEEKREYAKKEYAQNLAEDPDYGKSGDCCSCCC